MKNIDIEKLKTILPKYPGILGKNEYFNSAVLIPIVFLNGENHFLFEKRSEKIKQGGEICFPGGEFEISVDNNFEDTAIRETEEEIGISRDKIDVLGKLDTLIGPRELTVDSVVARLKITSLTECFIDKKEVDKVFTVPISFFTDTPPEIFTVISEQNHKFFNSDGTEENLIPSNKKSLNEHIDKSYRKSKRTVLVYKTNGEVIWGITARLVNEIVNKIKSME